jgi:peptidoglycan hydrolase-like protein with peptidoglycan-binding domain
MKKRSPTVLALCRSAAVVALSVCALGACSESGREARERQARDEILGSIKDVDAIALEQKVDAGVVKEVQQQLTGIKEYQGEVNGKLDSVTINAIQAFQRSVGLEDDGLLNDETRKKLSEAKPLT